MNRSNSLRSRLIPSRLAIIGTAKFAELGLTKEEIQLFVTEADRSQWTESMRTLIPTSDGRQENEKE